MGGLALGVSVWGGCGCVAHALHELPPWLLTHTQIHSNKTSVRGRDSTLTEPFQSYTYAIKRISKPFVQKQKSLATVCATYKSNSCRPPTTPQHTPCIPSMCKRCSWPHKHSRKTHTDDCCPLHTLVIRSRRPYSWRCKLAVAR